MSEPRLQRVADQDRRLIEITVDGWAMSAMEGDTLLVAILAQRGYLRDAPGGSIANTGIDNLARPHEVIEPAHDFRGLRREVPSMQIQEIDSIRAELAQTLFH